MVDPLFQRANVVIDDVDKPGAAPPIQVTATLDQVMEYIPAVIINVTLCPLLKLRAVGVLDAPSVHICIVPFVGSMSTVGPSVIVNTRSITLAPSAKLPLRPTPPVTTNAPVVALVLIDEDRTDTVPVATKTVDATLAAVTTPAYVGRYAATCVFPYIGPIALVPLAQNKPLVVMMFPTFATFANA